VKPDLLILDEPGNHLDYIGLGWLEKFLVAFAGSVLIVSHNRYLLDRVIGKIFELENCTLAEYEGNYSAYRMGKLRKLIAQQADYVANQKRLSQLETLVKRFAEIASSTSDPKWGKRLRARKTQLERERRQAVQRPVLNQTRISFDMESRKTKADIALQVNSYDKRYGDLVLFEDASLEISCGEKVALVGPNGSGKTTFLKDLVGRANWNDPTLRIGPSLSVGYCEQNQELFNPNATIWEEFSTLGAFTRKDIVSVLARFLFGWEDLEKPIEFLSGGEKNRLQLARFMMTDANFLILDEPTNHMDIPSKEAIEESLSTFDGTILLVSHDRYLLDKIATSIIEIRDKRFYKVYGNFSEYWASHLKLSRQLNGRVSTRHKQRRQNDEKTQRPRGQSGNRLSRIEHRLAELEEQKLKLEEEIAAAFSAGNHIHGRKLSNNLATLSRQIERTYEEWDRADLQESSEPPSAK
jgi:ATP-binding cassette subfamily F protein 3